MPDSLSVVTQSGGQAVSVKIRKMLRGKIHRATVTRADLHYEGSITVDATLMRAMDLYEYESVHVWNVSNGERFETYVLEGPADSGAIQVNGAAARKASPGDLIIIGAFTWLDEEAAREYEPKVVMVDGRNRIKRHPVAQLA
ncbi:MAG TPA: aspartate 1-decarboxylase [Candidatus Bathyarchaeia archaeon]|nr:aspartate 1-decarboxylase [Candidatus Bathyarchaeia archaeon]